MSSDLKRQQTVVQMGTFAASPPQLQQLHPSTCQWQCLWPEDRHLQTSRLASPPQRSLSLLDEAHRQRSVPRQAL